MQNNWKNLNDSEINAHIMENVSKKIKDYITEKDISISRFAGYVGISQKSMWSYVEKVACPSPVNLIKIATYFGVSIDHLISNGDLQSYRQDKNILVKDDLREINVKLERIELLCENFIKEDRENEN